jgi:hypothetical protein
VEKQINAGNSFRVYPKTETGPPPHGLNVK